MPDDYFKVNPEHKHIYRFIRMLFNAAQLTSECAIVTLVSIIFQYGIILEKFLFLVTNQIRALDSSSGVSDQQSVCSSPGRVTCVLKQET